MYLRALADGVVGATTGNGELLKSSQKAVMKYSELTLPYLFRKSTMDPGVLTKENIAEWKNTLKELKKNRKK